METHHGEARVRSAPIPFGGSYAQLHLLSPHAALDIPGGSQRRPHLTDKRPPSPRRPGRSSCA